MWARLGDLGRGLNTELAEQNRILDRVSTKAEAVGATVKRQNKDMSKIS